MTKKISIAFTINDSYAQHCCVLMTSILENNRNEEIDFYILTDYFSDKNKQLFEQQVAHYGKNNSVSFILVDGKPFDQLRLNIGHITQHTYYRFLLPTLLPQLDKVLYLDADIVVNGSIAELWDTDLTNYYCAGAEDLWIKQQQYKYHIGLTTSDVYVNAGVLLMNTALMRKDNAFDLLMNTAVEHGKEFEYQDQDVLNYAFRGRIKSVSPIFNFASDNVCTMHNVEPIIIHYNGRIKPWDILEKCRNPLRNLYFKYLKLTPYRNFINEFKLGRVIRNLKKAVGINVKPKKIKVGLVVDEYFGACGTAYGGYGFLARNYIAKYIPSEKIEVEVILFDHYRSKYARRPLRNKVDNVTVVIPPGRKHIRKWMRKADYDIYLTVELTHSGLMHEAKGKPIIHWIQAPRPWSDWRDVKTVKLFPEPCFWNSDINDCVHNFYNKGQVTFVSQANCLNEKAVEVYRLPLDTPVQYMPNPIEIDYEFDVATYPKKDYIIFVGRIESIKRGWLFCEIAKRMPQYEFYMIGQTLRDKTENEGILSSYRSGIPNLHFTGHLEGEEKANFFRDAKILVNTSILEALPITFLEAMAYGTLIVSCRDADDIVRKFGEYTGPVLGDGFDDVHKFTDAIERIMTDEESRKEKSRQAVEYIRQRHSVTQFRVDMRELIEKLTSSH